MDIAALFLDSLSPINFGQRIIYVAKRVGFIWINIPTDAERSFPEYFWVQTTGSSSNWDHDKFLNVF
jgi:hypothetical protein